MATGKGQSFKLDGGCRPTRSHAHGVHIKHHTSGAILIQSDHIATEGNVIPMLVPSNAYGSSDEVPILRRDDSTAACGCRLSSRGLASVFPTLFIPCNFSAGGFVKERLGGDRFLLAAGRRPVGDTSCSTTTLVETDFQSMCAEG